MEGVSKTPGIGDLRSPWLPHITMSWDDPPSMVTPRYDGGELLVKVPGLCRGANAKWPLAYLLAGAVQNG